MAALLAVVVLSLLSLALMLTTTGEVVVAANHRDSLQAAYAADAAMELAVSELGRLPSWRALLATPDDVHSGVVSAFAGASLRLTLADGTAIDLDRLTAGLNCPQIWPVPAACTSSQMNASTADRPWGRNNPRWRLYASGSATDLLPSVLDQAPLVLAVWVADDPAENDDDPAVDGSGSANAGAGIVLVRAEALGPHGLHRIVQATVGRPAASSTGGGYTGQSGANEHNDGSSGSDVGSPGSALPSTDIAP